MIKRYITLCAIFMAHMSFAALHNFHEPRELDPRDQKAFFDIMQDHKISRPNIIAAGICQETSKNAQEKFAVHALINPFNWHNAKLMSAPLLALFWGAMAYATRKSPPLRLLSAACMLVGLYKTWQCSSDISDLGLICEIYKNSQPLTKNHIPKEDQKYINQLSSWTRTCLRISHISMPTSNLNHNKIDKNFVSPQHCKPFFFGVFWRECYQQSLQEYPADNKKTFTMQYGAGPTFEVVVPIDDIPSTSAYFVATPQLVIYHHKMLNAVRVQQPAINKAYEDGRGLKFLSQYQQDTSNWLLNSDDWLFNSKTCTEINNQKYRSIHDYEHETIIIEDLASECCA